MTTRVVIGIQARSASSRFPAKVSALLGPKSVIEHVVGAAAESAKYLNRHSYKNGHYVEVALCVPYNDPLRDGLGGLVQIIEGPDEDVLSRYLTLAAHCKADYVVRVTGDCPLIPPFVISSLITKALANNYDYFANVDPRCRTTPSGWDCEVISKRLLEYAAEHATAPSDREHVTSFVRNHAPHWATSGAIVNWQDLSHIKLSVDTPEDLAAVAAEYERVAAALLRAAQIYGRTNVHRL